jgi:hypothetical protein
MVTLLTVLSAQNVWAACSTRHQLARLDASPGQCSGRQLARLDNVLSNRLQFRAVLDLPLARQVLRERKCPTVEDFETFVAAWNRLPGTGVSYTAKRYCLTEPTVYGIRFPFPDKRLDDTAAARLSADIDALQNELIPALASKLADVEELVR